jgi:sugar porter (SP) family MFS transporter
MANIYIILTACVATIGGFLFGYDVGSISGSIAMDQFLTVFPSVTQNDLLKGFTVSSFTAGCFIGALSTSKLADRFGRKYSCMAGAGIFSVGALLQTLANLLPLFIAGRIIAGFANGMLSTIIPLYLAELSPKEIRGGLVGAQELTVTIGMLVSFLASFGTHRLEGDIAFRLLFGIQLAFSLVMLIGMSVLPRSPRWLISRGRIEEAKLVLKRVRSTEDDAMRELEEIQEAIRIEQEIGTGAWSELKENGMLHRVWIGVGLQMFQQLTGINVIMHYSNAILKTAGFKGGQLTLLGTVMTGVVNVLMSLSSIYLIDRYGRRILLLWGALIMAASLSVLSILIAVYQPDFSVESIPWVCLIMICIFVGGYAFSWGPICWVYPSEIYPQRIRAKAVSLSTASNWLFNLLTSLLAPVLMSAIDWGFYLILVGFHVTMYVWVFFTVPETKGISQEEMDTVFNANTTRKSVSSANV